MSIGAILGIIHRDYRSQITSGKYFSIDGSLIKKEILVFQDYFDEGTNILDTRVQIHERIIRYLWDFGFWIADCGFEETPILLSNQMFRDVPFMGILKLFK